jgi:glycosyltransferase involved in cell wall biosynthesis
MQAPPELLRPIAEQMPKTQFIHINHSALPHLEREQPRFVDRFTASLHSARQVPNIWYASQDRVAEDVGKAAGIERAIWLPVPGHVLEPRKYRAPGERLRVVIAGRFDPIKNNLTQIVACGMMREMVDLVLCVEPNKQTQNLLHALQLPADVRGLLPHGEWLDLLRTEADVVLCCSHAESYGFVAAEAMQIGVPVIASPAIRFADPVLTTPGKTPGQIAGKIAVAKQDHQERASEAVKLGRQAAEDQLRNYLKQISYLGSTKLPDCSLSR